MAIVNHVFRITGVSPLLQNNPAETLVDNDEGQIKAKKKKYNDADEAKMRTYKEGRNYVHPSAGFRAGILRAGVGRKIGKTAAKSVLAGAVFPIEEFVVLIDPKTGKPLKSYEIDKRPVVIGTSRILRCRPKFTPWACDLAMEIDEDFVSEETVAEMLNISGRICGLGDFRPDTSGGKNGCGTFGRYTAKVK